MSLVFINSEFFVLIPIIINAYYTVIMGYSWFFLFSGFTSKLPWSDCSNDFNTVHCYSEKDNALCLANSNTSNLVYFNKSCLEVSEFTDSPEILDERVKTLYLKIHS